MSIEFSEEWLKQAAENEDGCPVSVGENMKPEPDRYCSKCGKPIENSRCDACTDADEAAFHQREENDQAARSWVGFTHGVWGKHD